MGRVLRVGLTGNIAAGKSSVARVWRELGAPVIDADILARQAVEPGTPALRQIVAEWGPDVLDAAGALDRAALREIVFRDSTARTRLEAIIHPTVGALRAAESRRAAGAGSPVVVADIPLLFETGMQREFDLVVLVDAPAAVRLDRIVRDRGLDRDTAARMVDAQMPAEQKHELADIVIVNTGTVQELEQRAAEVWQELVGRAAGRESDADG